MFTTYVTRASLRLGHGRLWRQRWLSHFVGSQEVGGAAGPQAAAVGGVGRASGQEWGVAYRLHRRQLQLHHTVAAHRPPAGYTEGERVCNPHVHHKRPSENDKIIEEPSILNNCFFLNAGLRRSTNFKLCIEKSSEVHGFPSRMHQLFRLQTSCCANNKTPISHVLIDSPTLTKCTFHTSITLLASLQDTPSILDWPLPQPSYDEVTAELDDQSEDQEVQSINKRLTLEDATVGATASAVASRSESQSADLFQELQREVQWSLFIVPFILLSVSHV